MSYRGQPVGRRSRDGSWQWMIIGIFLGMGCSLVMVLSANLFGFIEFSTATQQTEETPGVVVNNPTTPAPTSTTQIQPTTENVATQDPAAQPSTFTPDPSSLAPTSLPGVLPTNPGGGGFKGTGSNTTPVPGVTMTSSVGTPAEATQPAVGVATQAPITNPVLANASILLTIEGSTFRMGTSMEEAGPAVVDCNQRDGANCTEAMVTDSIPIHSVTLDTFKIEETEVSVAQYVTFLNYLIDRDNLTTLPHKSACGGQPCVLTTSDAGGENSDISIVDGRYVARASRDNYPVTLVTWYGADAYCAAIGRALPTEAQWERAARGNQNSFYPWGMNWDETLANTSRSGADGIEPIDSYPKGQTTNGVLNMAGNVAEWTADWYSANYYNLSDGATNPTGPASGDVKVVRGGSWDNPPLFARTVHRIDQFSPGEASYALGFRCVSNEQ
jgi:formylglycine-generating enzyme required for sulfatase activity